MNKILAASIVAVCMSLLAWGATPLVLHAEEHLLYGCSSQVYHAFENERLDAFFEATGVKIDLHIAPSPVCVNRLMNGFCDIASTTRGLHYTHKEAGYVETPFCMDPLAVIVNQQSHLNNLTKDQLRAIFRGEIINWSRLSGPDQPIVLAVPGEGTGAYKNFHRQVMRMKDIQYDYTSYQSTQIIELVRRIPGSISFITRGAVFGLEDIKVIHIDGIPPTHRDYPLSQTFSFVTRGKPTGPAKAFVDFALSDKGIAIIKKRGMVPIREYNPQGAE